MTRWYEYALAVGLPVALWWLGFSVGRLLLFYWRRWRVRREYAAICRLSSADHQRIYNREMSAQIDRVSLDAIARMERKP